MAKFNPKYFLNFFSKRDNRYRLILRQKKYIGDTYDVVGGVNPVIINHPKRNRKFTPIAGSKMDINLVAKTNEVDFDLVEEFRDITDREWQAELQKEDISNSWRADAGITTLNITTPAIPPVGSVTIANSGTFVKDTISKLRFTFTVGGSVQIFTFQLYFRRPNNFNGQVLSNPVSIAVYGPDLGPSTTPDEIAKRLAEVDSRVTHLTNEWDGTYAALTFTTDQRNDPPNQIDASWELGLTFQRVVPTLYQVTIWRKIEEASLPQLAFYPAISVVWQNKNPNSGTSSPIPLGTYNWKEGETPTSIVSDLVDIINGTDGFKVLNNVILNESTNESLTLQIYAEIDSTASNKINFYLLGAGEEANGTAISVRTINDTYLNLSIKEQSFDSYGLTIANFGGGTLSGDTFSFSTTFGTASIRAYENETIDVVIQRMVDQINLNIAGMLAAVDTNDASAFYVLYEGDASMASYSFTTIGGSTVTDNGPSWELSTSFSSIWQGYVIPGFTNVRHIGGNKILGLSALDGLGDLKNETFSVGDSAVFAKINFIEAIGLILEKTGLSLQIKESFDLYEFRMTTTKPPITQSFIDSVLFNSETCYYVLQTILTTIEAYIVQNNSTWELRPIKKLRDGVLTWRNYTPSGQYIGELEPTSLLKEVGSCSDNLFIGASAQILRRPPVKSIITDQDYGFVPQILQFPNFTDLQENIVDSYNFQYPWQWYIAATDFPFDTSITSSYIEFLSKGEDGVLQISAFLPPDFINTSYYLGQTVPIGRLLNLASTEEREYTFEIAFEDGNTTDWADELKVAVIIRSDETTDYYSVQRDDEDTGELNPVLKNEFAYMTERRTDDSIASKTLTQSFNFPYDENIESAYVEVRILSQPTGYTRISSCKITVNSEVSSAQRTSAYFTDLDLDGIQWRNKFVSSEEEVSIALGDVPAVEIASSIYKRGITIRPETLDSLSESWTEDPTADEPVYENILSHLRRTYLEEYGTPYNSLRATIEGDVQYTNVLQDKSNNDLLYICIQSVWNVRLEQIQGEWEQTNLPTDVDFFPTQLTTEVVQTEKSSSGNNSYTGGSGGGQSDSSEQDITFPVTAVNNQTGNITLTSDDIPSSGRVNQFVTSVGKVLAEKGGRVFTGIINDASTDFVITFNNEKAQIRNIPDGTTELTLNLALVTDSAQYSRQVVYILDNTTNSVKVDTLNFIDSGAIWVWEANTQPLTGIDAGDYLILRLTNISNLFVIAIATRAVGNIEDVGIGEMEINNSFIVR